MQMPTLLTVKQNHITLYGATVLFMVHIKKSISPPAEPFWDNNMSYFTKQDIISIDKDKKIMIIEAGEDDEPRIMIEYIDYYEIIHKDKYNAERH